MVDYLSEYNYWLGSSALSNEEREELLLIARNDGAIKERFFAPLEFGTGGLRGIMGAGINRMNVHVVRHTTQALAELIVSEDEEAMKSGVAVCFDCRHNSALFAREAACVLAAAGIKTYLFSEMRPTPELSFAVREYGCTAGINITASHNPKEYNGYKVYWNDGAQLPPAHASVVSEKRREIDIFTGVHTVSFEKAAESGLIVMLGEETDEKFIQSCLSCSVSKESVAAAAEEFKVVYTPFHGTGYKLIPAVLSRIGFTKIFPVKEQMIPDGAFPTVKSPNPEEKAGFALAIELAKKENATLIIGTDPDADRVGVVLRDNSGEYISLSGNQVGVLLLDYIIRAQKEKGVLRADAAAIKTIVTTEMARAVCEKNNVAVFDTFTGFKFMAEKIKEFEQKGTHKYILAFEESYGYLVGDHARDKDAVTASLLVAEMAAWHYNRGKTLYDAMNDLYAEYGFFAEHTINLVMPGLDGIDKMKALMRGLREQTPTVVGGTQVAAVRDYLPGTVKNLASGAVETLELSGSDVIYFELTDQTRFIIRPSGTEPKIKIYILASGKTKAEVDEKIRTYTDYAEGMRG